jgi:hypothetical protein
MSRPPLTRLLVRRGHGLAGALSAREGGAITTDVPDWALRDISGANPGWHGDLRTNAELAAAHVPIVCEGAGADHHRTATLDDGRELRARNRAAIELRLRAGCGWNG